VAGKYLWSVAGRSVAGTLTPGPETVVGTDLSAAAVTRARREATEGALSLSFDVADMCDLSTVAKRDST